MRTKMSSCAPVRKTTSMARKGRAPMCSTAGSSPSKSTRCMRPGPLQRNPYLNFLREYRKQCCGLSAVETVRRGAEAWKALSKDEKCRYITEAFYAPKRRKSMRNLRGTGVRRRMGTSKKSRMVKKKVKRSVRSRRSARKC